MTKTINKYTNISTKNGDGGTSRNYSNDELPKTDLLFDTIGSIDELSSILGVTYHQTDYKKHIISIQQELQSIMSLIATRVDDSRYERLTKITNNDIHQLEQWEQNILQKCKIEPRFVLPGSEGTYEGAHLDWARSVARRCERNIIRFVTMNQRTDLRDVIKYINRLSDLLFIMARSCDQ